MIWLVAFILFAFVVVVTTEFDEYNFTNSAAVEKKLNEFSDAFDVYVAMESDTEIMMCKNSTCVREVFGGLNRLDDQLSSMYAQVLAAIEVKKNHGFKTST